MNWNAEGEHYRDLFDKISGLMAARGRGVPIPQVVEMLGMGEKEVLEAQQRGLMPLGVGEDGERSSQGMFPEDIHRLWLARQMYRGAWGGLSGWRGNWRKVLADVDFQLYKLYGLEFFRDPLVQTTLIQAMAGMVELEMG